MGFGLGIRSRVQEGEQEERGEQAEVRAGAEWSCRQATAALEVIEQQQQEGGEGDGGEDRPRRQMAWREPGERRKDEAEEEGRERQAAERAQGEAGRKVGIGGGSRMLPRVDEKAVQAAEEREEQRRGEQDRA
jgi:hypothetical protein